MIAGHLFDGTVHVVDRHGLLEPVHDTLEQSDAASGRDYESAVDAVRPAESAQKLR
jgi:hypothetical protein